MKTALRKILVVGGNGFIGSAICKAALAKGMEVTSVSSSGRPYQSAKGHTPAWASRVDWQKGDALHPETFAHLLSSAEGVVHTLGTLLEGGKYKKAVKEGDLGGLIGSMLGGGNPLEKGAGAGNRSYEALNRDAALRVCEAYLRSSSPVPESRISTEGPTKPFVYISAEDIFRPVISARYIETKREAERGIEALIQSQLGYRGVYIRPGLVYHAHHRPLTTPAAVLLDISATLHSKVPRSLPTPSGLLRALGRASGGAESPLESMANCLVTPPIHVDSIAEAVCFVLSTEEVHGVVDVHKMRDLIGWRFPSAMK
ncbi:hypothetical protein BD779DRAFT_1509560 [Infundibulicybe gibba]|nr:hypothetical protein BD779DRAFT_1509560 [Infundibulicybe gibba]